MISFGKKNALTIVVTLIYKAEKEKTFIFYRQIFQKKLNA